MIVCVALSIDSKVVDLAAKSLRDKQGVKC